MLHDFNFRQVIANLENPKHQKLEDFLTRIENLKNLLEGYLPYPSKRETEDGTFFAVRG